MTQLDDLREKLYSLEEQKENLEVKISRLTYSTGNWLGAIALGVVFSFVLGTQGIGWGIFALVVESLVLAFGFLITYNLKIKHEDTIRGINKEIKKTQKEVDALDDSTKNVAKSNSGQISISGDVSGSTIIIGGDNKLQS